jgi:prolyl oligopeptidase
MHAGKRQLSRAAETMSMEGSVLRFLALLATAVITVGQAPADPYRYLESAGSARTQQWIDTQNAKAERTIGAYPGNAEIVKRVGQLALTGPQQYGAQLAGSTLYFMREVPPAAQAVLMAQSWPHGTPHVVLDPSTLGTAVSVDYIWPSPDGRLIAVGTSSGGSESTTIRLFSLSGEQHADTLGPAGGGTTAPVVAWDANGRGFTYGRLPANGSQFGIKLYHHVIGAQQSDDTLALGAISPIAEYNLVTSSDARQAAALVQFGDGAFLRVYFRDASHWNFAVGPQAGITTGAFVDNRLFVVATAGSPHGRIAAVTTSGTLQTIVPEEASWAMHEIAPMKSGFLVTKSWGTTWRVDQYDVRGRMIRTVALPSRDIGIRGIASDDAQDNAVIEYSGWAGPVARWVAYDATNGALHTIYNLDPPSQKYREIQVHELSAVSKDGTHIPVTVLSLAGTPQNGTAPAMLTGYGGFGLSTSPYYIGTNFAWLEMGGIYAVANIRGGSEFGEQWHQQGMLTNKQNVFDDFYASAQALVNSKWTTPSRLGIIGGSNGGLLVGAALVQHPQAYRAVVGVAGIYDTLRHHLFPNGAYNVSEYGSTENQQQLQALYAYAPYYNVKKGVAYPAVLLITSENDPRVAPWQSWKFGAALESATSSGRPVLVLTRQSGGHGHGASFAQRVGNTAVELSFMASQLGITASP